MYVMIDVPKLVSPSTEVKGARWLFGYDLSDELMQSPGKIQCVDFRKLLYTSNAGAELKRAARFFERNKGTRFADYRYRNMFRVYPPKLSHLG